MTNQASLPIIQFPVIPSEWCPVGTWAQIFNQWQTQYGGSGVINIPGLGDVTPASIAQINATLVVLQNEIDLITKAYRHGDVVLSTGDNNIVLTFDTTMPSADYDVGVIFIDTAGVATATFGWAIVAGTQAASGVTIRAYDIPASVTTGTYWVRQR